MERQQQVQKTASPQSTATSTPANFLQTRPFAPVEKTPVTDRQEKPDLREQIEWAERFNCDRLVSRPQPLYPQPKLTLGRVGDKYEQEADRVAKQVVQRLNTLPTEALSIQRQEMREDEELQMKLQPLSIQRQDVPESDEELQRLPIIQRVSSDGGMAVTQELEASIHQARGSGQPLLQRIREPMEQAFGADFSNVRVHADTQSDQLNQSIQARAFTTGQDIFFRQGAYDPGSRGGQELLAHELTHVVQQTNASLVQTSFIQKYTDEDVKKRAYLIWKQKGERGTSEENYFEAQRQLALEERAYFIWKEKGETGTPEENYFEAEKKENLLVNQNEAINLLKNNSGLLGDEIEEIKQSVWKPEKINQAQFNFCGPNDFLMAIAFNNPVNYVKYIIDLYTAKALYEKTTEVRSQTAKLGNMVVEVDQGVVTAKSNKFYSESLLTSKISQTDWMSMGSIRTHATATAEEPIQDEEVKNVLKAFAEGGVSGALKLQPSSKTLQEAIMVIKKMKVQEGQTLESIAKKPSMEQTLELKNLRKIIEGAMPSEIAEWFAQYGANDIQQNADPFTPTKTAQDIEEANKYLNASQGKMVMLSINSDTIEDKHQQITKFDPTQSHWVLMKTPLEEKEEVWEGKVYSWGKKKTIKIKKDKIAISFFGFVAATIETPKL